MAEHRIFYRRNLPHFQPPGATIFFTFRLAGSIPQQVLERLATEARLLDQALADIDNEKARRAQAHLEYRRLFGRYDKALDACSVGPRWLEEPEIAELIVDALHHRDEQVYRLDAYAIMPNHVHLLYTPLQTEAGEYIAIADIMQSLKRYTAQQANILLNRSGQFWQHESYDHASRDTGETERIIRYILNNPVKAGLANSWHDWPWVYSRVPL